MKTSKAETRAAAAVLKTTPHQIGNPGIGISLPNLEPILASKRFKPIRQKRKRSHAKRVIPIQSRKCHRPADRPDSLDPGRSLCPPPIPNSPQHCFLPPNVMPDPASLSSGSGPRLHECPVQQSCDKTSLNLSVSSLPRHPLYFSLSSISGHPRHTSYLSRAPRAVPV